MRIMKKAIAAFLIAVITTTAVYASAGIKNYWIDNEKKIFSVEYDYSQSESASIIVYDVSSIGNPTVDTEYVSMEKTPVVALEQEIGDGRFDLKLKENYTGRVILVIGSSDESFERILLKIENGSVRSIVIPNTVSVDIDADGLTKTLSEGDSMVIESAGLLKNAVVDANAGNITIGTTNVKGKVRFNSEGKITADSGESITLESESKTVTKSNGETYTGRNIGFIKSVYFGDAADKRTLSISYGETTLTKEYNTSGMIGNFRFEVAIKGVPENVAADSFTVNIK